MDPSGLASDLAVYVGLVGQVQGVLREPWVSLAHLNSDGAGPSVLKFTEEAKDSDPEGSDDEVEVNLDDEPRSLLDFLNTYRRKVASSLSWVIPGLSCHIELELLDLLIF